MAWTDRLAKLLLRDALPESQAPHLVHFGTMGGVNPYGLTEQSALGLSAINRCVSIIAGGLSILEWGEWRGTLQLPSSRLVARPMESMTRREWTWRVAATMALHNTCHLWAVGGRDPEGVPWSLVPIPPNQVRAVGGVDTFGVTIPDHYQVGRNLEVPPSDIFTIRRAAWPIVPDTIGGLLNLARMSFASALSAEGYASRYWQAGGPPTTVISTEAELTGTQADEIAARWRDRRAGGPDYPAVFGKGAKAQEWGADPTEQSAVEARRELVADIGRYFGVGTALLNAPAGDPTTYRTTESEGLAFIRFTLGDYLRGVEDLISDILPGVRRMVMDPAPLTRGEQYTRYQAWQLALSGDRPWLTVEEVRSQEGYGPLEPAGASLPQVEAQSILDEAQA